MSDSDIVNFPLLVQMIFVSALIRFARASSYVKYFNNRIKIYSVKLLIQGYPYQNYVKHFKTFIADTLNWLVNIKLAWKHFGSKEYRNQSFTAT